MQVNISNTNVRSAEEVIALSTFTVLIVILSVPANALVLLANLTSPQARRKPSNYLLVNVTISEFVTALVVMPLQLSTHIIKTSLIIKGGVMCTLVGIASYPFYIVSVATMVCISIDRFYAIHSPLGYKTKMTGKRIAGMIGYTWLHGTTFAFVSGFVIGVGPNNISMECGIRWREVHIGLGVFVATTHIVLPFTLLTVFNYNLVISLRRQNRTLESHLEQELNVVLDQNRVRKNKSRQAQERKITRMVLWIITTHVICWVPYFVTRVLSIIPIATSPLIDATAVLILHVSVVINPVLNLVFRKELRFTLERLFRRRNDRVFPIKTATRTFMSAETPSGDARVTVAGSK